jgi:hypothetical protein
VTLKQEPRTSPNENTIALYSSQSPTQNISFIDMIAGVWLAACYSVCVSNAQTLEHIAGLVLPTL